MVNKKKNIALEHKVLEKLLVAFGPSNDVGDVTSVLKRELRDFVDFAEHDTIGNFYAVLEGNPSMPTTMYFGHADTIGFAVAHVTDRGQVYVRDITGLEAVRAKNLAGQQIVVKNRKTNELHPLRFVNPVAIHLEQPADETDDQVILTPCESYCQSSEVVYRRFNDGDFAVFMPNPSFRRSNSSYWIESAGLDDRLGLYTIVMLAKELAGRPKRVRGTAIFNATISEETAANIAMSVAFYKRRPDMAINIDVTPASDSIQTNNDDMIAITYGKNQLGHGPVLSRGSGVTDYLFMRLEQCAHHNDIPYQTEIGVSGTENVATLSAGIPSALVSLPARYTHTDHELADMRDVAHTVKLLKEFHMLKR